jgi:hypothetical protein
MTGPCSGAGVGQLRSGVADLQYVGPAAIGGALAGLSGWQGAAVGAAIGSLTYDLTTFCPNGPPAMPTFTVEDIINLLSPVAFPTTEPSRQKFRDFVGNLFWPVFCECSSGTPTLGTPSVYPSGGPGTGAAAPTATQLQPCHDQVSTFTIDNGGPFEYAAWLWHGTPSDLTSLRVIINQGTTGNGTHTPVTWRVITTTNSGITVKTDVTLPLLFSQQVDVPVVSGATEIRVQGTHSGADSAATTLQIQGFCTSSPIGPSAGCCPPDPINQAILAQILDMVTLVQRQAAPFAYVYGANHTALSGHGSIAASGLIGVSVDVTTLPGSYGSRDGSPVELFDLGFVTLGTADGYETSRRIDHDGTLILPPQAGAFTAIGYSLSPGVVVAIRELIREP